MDKPKKPNKKLLDERKLRGWSQQYVAESLGTDFKRVSAWENGSNVPSPYYRAKLCTLFGKNTRELGFLDQRSENSGTQESASLSNATIEEARTLRTAPILDRPSQETNAAQTGLTNHHPSSQSIQLLISGNAPVSVSIQVHEQTFAQLPDGSGIFVPVDGQPHAAAYSSHENTITNAGSDAVDRRDFFRETGRAVVVGAALLASHNMHRAELLDRFQRALKKPSTIDERLLNYLQIHTEEYWRDRHSAVLASNDLLDYVIEHFHKVTQLLERPMLPSQRIQLCVIASKTAQLAGHLLFDIGDHAEARRFHEAAIIAAQEVDNNALQATAWARISFTWTYGNNALEANRCIKQARYLAIGSTNSTVQAYLAAVEAEIQAILGDKAACLKALNQAEHIEDQQHTLEDSYWLRFDHSRLEGYKGICFRRLYHPGDPQATSFLTEGQNALKNALAQLDPMRIQRQPVLLIDLADTYTLQGDIEAACEYATKAIPLVDQIKSQAACQRLLKLRKALKPWQETQHVQNLDSLIAQYSFFTPIWSKGIN